MECKNFLMNVAQLFSIQSISVEPDKQNPMIFDRFKNFCSFLVLSKHSFQAIFKTDPLFASKTIFQYCIVCFSPLTIITLVFENN